MIYLLNNDFIDANEITLPIQDRQFQYGDGLFETIRVSDGLAPLLTLHFKRLKEGMEMLQLVEGVDIDEDATFNNIKQLIEQNRIESHAKVKIKVWRKEAGTYTPKKREYNLLITVENHQSIPAVKKKVSFSKKRYIAPSPISMLKTSSALPYILASIEMKDRELDEIILLNHIGHITECSHSNIFWVKDGIYYTPSLETGCINGVMRTYIINTLKKQDIIIKEATVKPEDFIADTVFMSNATGIVLINHIDGHSYQIQDLSFLSPF